MAQNENYSQVDLRVGTEEQFNAKVGTLPAGTLFGTTDSTVSKADLSTDLKNEINGKINKPANPTSDSAVVINSSGEISTKPLNDISGKTEVAVSSTTPSNDEILWINPDGTSGGGSSGGGKLYRHKISFTDGTVHISFNFIDSNGASYTSTTLKMPTENNIIYVYNDSSDSSQNKKGFGYIYSVNNGYCSYGGIYILNIYGDPLSAPEIVNHIGANMSTEFVDTVTEL